MKNQSNPGLSSGIFFLISSIGMGCLFFAFLVLAVAIAISQPAINLFLTIYYYLVLITSLWFLLYGILMCFKQFAKKKSLTVTNLIFILLNLVAFVILCVLVNGENLDAVFQLMWLYLVIMIVGLLDGIFLLKKVKKLNSLTQSNTVKQQPVTAQEEIYTVDGNDTNAQLDINTNKSDSVY